MCRYIHNTSAKALPSIREHGLLTREKLEVLGQHIRYADFTRPGSVYLTDLTNASSWQKQAFSAGHETVLCVEPVPDVEIIPDRNFENEKTAFCEHRAPVPPERIKVHHADGTCIPITQYT